MFRRFFPALLVLGLAASVRLGALDEIRQNYDRAYPHGQGIDILEQIQAGRLDRLPVLGVTASIDLPNPVGASYAWAAVAAVERDAYSATALVALASLITVAAAYGIGAAIAGPPAAIVAGVLAASGPWTNWVSRGAWLQGTIETFAALTAWLAFTAIRSRSGRRAMSAGAVAAVAMQTYLVAFGLSAQLALALAFGGGLRRDLRRSTAIALALCAASALMFGGIVFINRERLPRQAAQAVVERDGRLNLDAINHWLRIASGRDFENTFVEADTPGFAALDQTADTRATLIELMLIVGAVLLAWRARKDVASRALLSWSLLPVLAALFVANALFRAWEVHVFYIMLASPMSYVLAGLPAGVAWQAQPRRLLRPVAAALVGMSMLAACISLVAIAGDAAATMRFPYNHDGMTSLPLGSQRQLAALWRAHCTSLAGNENRYWLASLLGTARPVHADAYRSDADSSVWAIAPGGTDCAIQVEGSAPGSARLTRLDIAGQKRTDRTPVAVSLFAAEPPPAVSAPLMATNLGWSLTRLDVPATIRPGELATVTHAWRIDGLPAEPFADWYFAPFIKLVDPRGAVVVNIDKALALEGKSWRQGDTLLSTVQFRLPVDAASGDYELRLSLFDPNQKKNAVYFDTADPRSPVVEIRRKVTVGP